MEGAPAKEGVFWQFNCSSVPKDFFPYCVSSNNNLLLIHLWPILFMYILEQTKWLQKICMLSEVVDAYSRKYGLKILKTLFTTLKVLSFVNRWVKLITNKKSFQGGFGNVVCLGDKTWKQSLNSLLFQFRKLYTSFVDQIVLSTWLGLKKPADLIQTSTIINVFLQRL